LTEPSPSRPRRRAFDWSTAIIAAVAFAAAAAVYVRDGREHFLDIHGSDVTLFGEMLPKVLAGCLIGAFVTCRANSSRAGSATNPASPDWRSRRSSASCCRAARSRSIRWPAPFS